MKAEYLLDLPDPKAYKEEHGEEAFLKLYDQVSVDYLMIPIVENATDAQLAPELAAEAWLLRAEQLVPFIRS